MTQSQLKQIARDVAEEVYLPQLSQDAYELLVYRITQAITTAILSERESIAQLLEAEPGFQFLPPEHQYERERLATLIRFLPIPPTP